jgi:Rho GTPase-activating protein 44
VLDDQSNQFDVKRKKFLKDRGGKGIYFGESLENSYKLCEQLQIPHLFDQSVEFLSTYALQEEGILRLSAGDIEKKTLKKMLDDGCQVTLASYSVHAVAAVLKEYFRELPTPLIPFELYQQFVNSYNTHVTGSGLSAIPPIHLKELIFQIQPQNRRVLLSLIAMLFKVSTYSDVNKMTPSNLAIVFGQNLLRSNSSDLMKVMSDTTAVNGVIESMIIGHHEFEK